MRRVLKNDDIIMEQLEYENKMANVESKRMQKEVEHARGVRKNYDDKVEAVNQKLREKIERFQTQQFRKIPKGFNFCTAERSHKYTVQGKERREQAAYVPPLPKFAAKHERPFSCHGKSSKQSKTVYFGNTMSSLANGNSFAKNADIKNQLLSHSNGKLQRHITIKQGRGAYLLNDTRNSNLTTASQSSFKNLKTLDEHVHRMYTGDNGSTRKLKCRSCCRGVAKHNWPENRTIKISKCPRIPKLLKRIALKRLGLQTEVSPDRSQDSLSTHRQMRFEINSTQKLQLNSSIDRDSKGRKPRAKSA